MKKIIFLIFSIAIFIFSAAGIFAADFLFFGAPANVNTGDEFKIDAIIDAKEFPINALSGKIIFSENLLDVDKILTGNSGINLWVEPPQISQPGTINFSGIVPNGFNNQLLIFSVIFRAKTEGEANINFATVQALLNDGNGTEDATVLKNISIQVNPLDKEKGSELVTVFDTTKPDNFIPQIIKTQNLFNGDYAIIFQTQDKQSGIDHYEIMERKTFHLFQKDYTFGIWKKAESPYRLNDQKLKSDIFVKAIDKQGNDRISAIQASSSIFWYENPLFCGIIVLLMAITFACILIYAKKRNKKNK